MSYYSIAISSDEFKTFDDWSTNKWYSWSLQLPIQFLICVILIPICLLQDMSKMRFANFFSIASFIYAILVIVIECPFFYQYYEQNIYKQKDPSTYVNWHDLSTGFTSQLLFFQGSATIFFSFTCHVGAFPVYKTLKNNITRRINKVFMRSIIMDTVIYLLVGVSGYLTEPYKTQDLIIYRTNTLDESDIFMVIARLGMALNLILSTPANYNAIRLSIVEIIWGINTISNFQ